MNVEGRNFFVDVNCFSVEGLDGVVVEFKSGKQAIYDEDELNEMYALAEAATSGKRTAWTPNEVEVK
tara:strand:+ start:210 stop:410 length:201 start_codon:yes stop_codon:yes gene_type:complete